MTIFPLRDRVMVRRDDADCITPGGIVLPDGMKDKPQRGTVVAVGAGKRHYSAYHMKVDYEPMDVREGDRIIFTKYAGEGFEVGGEKYFLVKEEDIIARISEE